MAKVTSDEAQTVAAPIVVKKSPAKSSSLFASLNETEEYLNILLFGREGSGKTTTALSLTNIGYGKVLVVNAEGGLKRNTLKRHGIDIDRIMIWPPLGESITHRGLDEVYRQIKADLADDPKSWAGIVFDSATEVVQALVDHVAQDRMEKASRRGISVDGVDQFFTDRSDYGTMSKMFRDILRKFRDLPAHFIVTALERRDVDEESGKVQYGPAVTPGVQSDLLGYVDLVLACSAAEEEEGKPFRALTKSSGKYRGKDRLGVLPRIMVEPTLTRILAYASGSLTEAKDTIQSKLTKKENTNA